MLCSQFDALLLYCSKSSEYDRQPECNGIQYVSTKVNSGLNVRIQVPD